MYLHTFQLTLFPSQMDRSIWKTEMFNEVSDPRSMPDFLYHEWRGSAQIKAMKKIAETNPITDLVQYRELAAFAEVWIRA